MALLAAMVALVTVGVFFRSVVDASRSWYDEFAASLLVWLSFYGAVVATYRNRDISFDAFVDRMSERARRVTTLVSEALSIAFHAVLLVYGTLLVQAVGHETAVSLQAVRMAWCTACCSSAGAHAVREPRAPGAARAGPGRPPAAGRPGRGGLGRMTGPTL